MALLVPLTIAQARQLLISAFTSATGTPPNTDALSAIQPLFNAVSQLFVAGQVNLDALENLSRLATSFGSDVDSFVQPFGYAREGASPASGTVTFSNPSAAGAQLVVPVGTIVQTGAGLQYTVVADPSQTGYSAANNGYLIAPGGFSVDATVVCTTPGAIGNVQIGIINAIFGGGGPTPPVQAVTNAQAFTNGADRETDAELKTRFTLGQSGGHVATANAIGAAILAVQPGLTYSVGDRVNATGAGTPPSAATTAGVVIPAVGASVAGVAVPNPNLFPIFSYVIVNSATKAFYGQITAIGTTLTIKNLYVIVGSVGDTVASGATVLFVGGNGYFTVVVNVLGQSSGPSTALLAAVAVAVDGVRSAGISRTVIGPTLVAVNGTGNLVLAKGANASTVLLAAQAAYDAYVNGIGLDPAGAVTTCSYMKVGAVLLGVPGVVDVTGLQLNGGIVDITAAFANQLIAGTFVFTTSGG